MIGNFGSYTNLNTFLHKFDSRLKFLSFIFLAIVFFMNVGIIGYVFKMILMVILMILARVPMKAFYNSLKITMILFTTLFLIQWLVVKPGTVGGHGETGALWLGKEGAWYALYESALWKTLDIIFKVVLMINLTNVLMMTTSPIDLTFSIEDLLSPLKKIKLSPHIPAMILSIAIRSVPTLMQESERILKAQASRGADFKNGKFFEKITTIIALIIPLFSISIQRAEDMADAMEIRGYDPYGKRTRYRRFRIRMVDVLSFIVVCTLLSLTIVLVATGTWIQIPQDKFIN